MIDVNKITSTLAKLPDAMLQKYAQLNKADPYIMALAMSESNRRKELRSAGQGAMQAQPKVVDRGIAEMAAVDPMGNVTGYAGGGYLPEDQGIGRLNAGNMNFANGGIIAFADGGDVPRFNGTQSQFVQDIMGIPQQYTEYQQRIRESDRIKAERERAMEQRRQDELAARQKTSFANYLFGSPEREAEGKAELAQLSATPVGAPARSGTMPEPGYTRPGMLYDPRLNTPPTQPVVAAPAADTGRPKPLGAGPVAAAAAAVPEKSVAQRYADMQKEMGMGPEGNADLEWRRSQLAERRRAQSKGELEDFDKEAAARGEAFKGREERLAKREAGLSKMKDETTGLALLEAGLAIMSTPGGLATAIGKGAQTGLKTYGAGLEKLRSAQEKMEDARDQIEEFRRNEANMTAKERRQFKSAINRTETEIEKDSLDAAEKMFGYKREDAKAVFTAATQERLTDREIESREKISRAQIAASGRNSQLETLRAVMADPRLAAAYQSMHGKGVDVMGEYNDFVKANPLLAADPKAAMTQFLMTKSVFSQLGKPTVTDRPSTNVRTQP